MAFTYNTVGVSGYSGYNGSSGYSGVSGWSGYAGTSLLVVTQSNSFTPGQAIYRTTGSYALAQANAVSSCDVIGVIQSATSTALTAVINGSISGLAGLTDATEYYLSDQTAGLLTSIPPSANGSIIKPVLISTSTTTGIVLEYPGVQIGATNYGTSGYVAKWTTNQSIGNSTVTDNGSGILVNGTLAVGTVTNATNASIYSTNQLTDSSGAGYSLVMTDTVVASQSGTGAQGAYGILVSQTHNIGSNAGLTYRGVTISTPNIVGSSQLNKVYMLTIGAAPAVSAGGVAYGIYQPGSTPNLIGGNTTFSGTISAVGWVNEAAVAETTTVSAAAPGSTIQFDTLTQSVLLYTSNVVNNWTLNVRGNSTTPLSSILNVGQTITLTLMTSAGGSGYYQTGMTIDGANVTAKWQGGTAPSSGDTSAMDIYSYSITRVSTTPSYVVVASVAKFA